ncbi:MAG TPA: hypothetical protein VKB38_25090 [Terracidiphilus sp.]|nr:hypothetical protein [Terracidiphilus sp.]
MTNSSTKGALGMLIAVVLWTTAPLIACVPGLRSAAKSDCCLSMGMEDCSGPMINSSCCDFAPIHSNPALASAFTPFHAQESGLLAQQTTLPLIADPNAGQLTFIESPPPDPSPGGLSVLRI